MFTYKNQQHFVYGMSDAEMTPETSHRLTSRCLPIYALRLAVVNFLSTSCQTRCPTRARNFARRCPSLYAFSTTAGQLRLAVVRLLLKRRMLASHEADIRNQVMHCDNAFGSIIFLSD